MATVDTHRNTITLAVFPFENLSNDEASAIICKSFCFDLISELSKFRQFQIIAYNSIKDINQPGNADSHNFEKLETDYYIIGSFRQDKSMLRVNAQLVNSTTRHLVWADRLHGKSEDLIDLQEDLLKKIVSNLQLQLNYDLLQNFKKRKKVNLKAYECWLYGLEELKKGSVENDEHAREYFLKAIDIDPDYSLAYTGMSMTYFNEWSCQLWEKWDASQNGAYKWATKAIDHDDQNYVAAYVLGRIFLYDRNFEKAEHYLRKSLLLNENDPDSLIQISSCLLYLGYMDEAYELYEKALRLNPSMKESYFQVGALILFEKGAFKEAAKIVAQLHSFLWIDAPAIFAAIFFHLKDLNMMGRYWKQYMEGYVQKINKGEPATFEEAIGWQTKISPYSFKSNLEPFWDYISNGSQIYKSEKANRENHITPQENVFTREGKLWKLSYIGMTVQMPDAKGLHDIQKLLEVKGQPVHCAELMGGMIYESDELVLDDKAKRNYKKRISDLQEEIKEAELNSNMEKVSRLQLEYDQLIDHLSKNLGLNGRIRKVNSKVEKARSAVTWRIRNTISKIKEIHEPLGKHLGASIKTGILCSYIPENETKWILD